jgi:hypothetical protein
LKKENRPSVILTDGGNTGALRVNDTQDNKLLAQVRRVHMQSRQAYGAKKTWLAVKAQGIACGKHSVARLRKQAGIEARRKRRACLASSGVSRI